MLQQIVLLLNTLVSLGSTSFALIACARPDTFNRSGVSPRDDRFYPAMYAFRAVPLGLLAAATPLLTGSAVPVILGAAALVQLGDAGLGLRRRTWRMVGGALAAAGIHIATAVVLAGSGRVSQSAPC